MNTAVTIEFGAEVIPGEFDAVYSEIEELLDKIKELAEKAWAAAGDEARAYATDASGYLQEGFEESKTAIKTTLSDAVKGSLGPLFRGEIGRRRTRTIMSNKKAADGYMAIAA